MRLHFSEKELCRRIMLSTGNFAAFASRWFSSCQHDFSLGLGKRERSRLHSGEEVLRGRAAGSRRHQVGRMARTRGDPTWESIPTAEHQLSYHMTLIQAGHGVFHAFLISTHHEDSNSPGDMTRHALMEYAAWNEDATQKVQQMEFPCPDRSLWRSEFPPSSVHRLRPGDIDVVAAIGDSLTAANGALSDNLFEVIFKENRGVSWSIGGQGNWTQFLTVPNLLKVMNPNLVGYSLGDGRPYTYAAQFSAAYNGAMDQDLMEQATWLVNRMRRDPRVDLKNHWKMITLMIGTNDICSDQCYIKRQGVETHRKNIIKVLDYLYENLPKTLINLVSMPYIPAYADLVNPPFPTCITMKLVACSCLFGGLRAKEKLSNVINMTRAFQRTQWEIAESGRYDQREDFTVVYQPTNLNSRFPKLEKRNNQWGNGDPHDYSYISIDCIHYTQKLHSIIANVYWNNLFEDPGEKTTTWDVPAYRKFLCPKRYKPYIVTRKNYRWRRAVVF